MARGRFERLLHDALVVGQFRKDCDTACSLLEEAMHLDPAAYLPYLFAAAFSSDPLPLLEQALSRNPASIQALLLSAQYHAERSNLKEAATRILAAAHACPSYPLPYVRMAELLTLLGQEREAEVFFRIAAEKCSHFEDSPRAGSARPSA
jgi:Tfp pilus assembly protein PilF